MPKGEFIIMKKHGLAIFILAAVMTLDSAGMTALAAEGWAQEGNSWVYYNASGSRVYNAWRKGGDGCWRYLDSYGVMASNAWVDDGRYYVDADGIMVAGQWLQIADPNSEAGVSNY